MTRTIIIALMLSAAAHHLYAAESVWKQKHDEAVALFRAGQYTDAQTTAFGALEIARKDNSQVNISKSYNTIGILFSKLGESDLAEYHYRQAVSIGRECLAKDSKALANMLSNYALLLDKMMKDRDAKALFHEALAIYEMDPADSPEKAQLLANVARYYIYRDEFNKAEPLLNRSLAMAEKTFGNNYGYYIETYYTMCAFYARKGLQETADKYLEKGNAIKNNSAALAKAQAALAIAEESGDEGSIATALNALAFVLHDAMLFDASEAHYERAIGLARQSFGEDSLKVANMLSNKAHLYLSMRRFSETIPLYEQALAIYEKNANPDGSNDADMARLLCNLGNDYNNHAEFEMSEPILIRSLAMAEKSLGKEHGDLIRILQALNSVYRQTDRVELATECKERADAIEARQEQGASTQ